MMEWRVVLLGAVALAVASPTLAQEPVRQDSAGVEIVTSRAGAARRWQVHHATDFRVGGPTSDLWQLRAVTQAPDGRVIVLSGGTFEVHVFGPDGEIVAILGGRGEGPCEFVRPTTLRLASPDTILVMDRDAIDVFLLDGSCVGTVPARAAPDAFGRGIAGRPMHSLADGSLLMVGSEAPLGVRVGEPFRLAQYLGVASSDGEFRVLGQYPGVLQERVDVSGGNPIVVAPFPRHSSFQVSPESPLPIAAADNDAFSIHLFDASGALRRIIRRPADPVAVHLEWVEAWKDRQRGRGWTTRNRQLLERQWAQMTIPETLPAFEGFVLDQEGAVWVQRVVVDPAAPIVFDIFDATGAVAGELALPAGMTGAPHIGPDYILAVWEDGLGVETVRRYRFQRPG